MVELHIIILYEQTKSIYKKVRLSQYLLKSISFLQIKIKQCYLSDTLRALGETLGGNRQKFKCGNHRFFEG